MLKKGLHPEVLNKDYISHEAQLWLTGYPVWVCSEDTTDKHSCPLEIGETGKNRMIERERTRDSERDKTESDII